MSQIRQKWNAGDVVKIPLGNKKKGFGRVLKKPLVAFYELTEPDGLNYTLDSIVASRVIFKVWIMHYAVTSGDWPIIGNLPLKPELEIAPIFYKQDQISGALSIYLSGGMEKPATFEDCQGLECAAVWNPDHVVERLNDHFAGRPNKWVEIMKPNLKM